MKNKNVLIAGILLVLLGGILIFCSTGCITIERKVTEQPKQEPVKNP